MGSSAGEDSRKPADHMPAGFYEQIVDTLTSGVLAVDAAGCVLIANPAACAYLDVEMQALSPGVSLHGVAGVAPLAAIFDEMKAHSQPLRRREIVLEPPAGNRVIGLNASLLEGPDVFNGAAFLFTDLTKVRELEREADLNRQLAQVGELTAGVIHELRNPLGIISGMTELLLRGMPEDEKLRQKAKSILKETEHLGRLVDQFLSFARPFELHPKSCLPQDILWRAMQLCEKKATDLGVALETQLGQKLPRLEADTEKAAQALANIVQNGIELQESGGRMSISCVAEEGGIRFRVEDEGPGLHLEEGKDPFAPFVSQRRGGTGLGLSIVHRIVTGHGGKVTCGNRTERGAWFEMRLPLTLPSARD